MRTMINLAMVMAVIAAVGCSSMPYVPSDSGPSVDTQTDWLDTVPREPVWVITASAGVRDSTHFPDENARGNVHWWRGPDASANLIDRIREGYSHGARRFFVNRPHGTDGASHVSGASWLTLLGDRREELPRMLADLMLDELEEEIHITWFIGSNLRDPRDIAGDSNTGRPDFYMLGETETYEQQLATRFTLGGWISTGAGGLAIDHSTSEVEREHFMDLYDSLRGDPFNLTITGEAFPTAGRDAEETLQLDADAIQRMGWLATDTYIRHESRWGPNDLRLTVDPERTRMFVWFEHAADFYGDQADQRDLIKVYVRNGFIPMTSDPFMFETAMTIYRLMEGIDDPDDPVAVVDKKIMICMPGSEEWNRHFLDQIGAAGFPLDETEYVLQVGARFKDPEADNPRDGLWPDLIMDFLNASDREFGEYIEETVNIRLDRSWAPKPFVSAFYDFEPTRTMPNGGTHSWMGQGLFRDAFARVDAEVMTQAVEECKRVLPDLQWGFYGLPRYASPGLGAPSQDIIDAQQVMMPLFQALDYHQINMYPHGGDPAMRDITPENQQDHYDRIIEGWRAHREVAGDKPIHAIMWPRWQTDNAAYFDFYLRTLNHTDVDTLILWVNPHSEVMSNVYARETIEAIPAILAWLNEPLR